MNGLRPTALLASLLLHAAAAALLFVCMSNRSQTRADRRPSGPILTLVTLTPSPRVETPPAPLLMKTVEVFETERTSSIAPAFTGGANVEGTFQARRVSTRNSARFAASALRSEKNSAADSIGFASDAAFAGGIATVDTASVADIITSASAASIAAADAENGGLKRAGAFVYLRTPKPDYPATARRRRLEGVVLLDVVVNESGRPVQVALKQSSGHRVLDDAAAEAVRQWEFQPATAGARITTAQVEVPVRFQLSN